MLEPSSQTNATEDNLTTRKRPRIEMAASAQRDRKRGRSMFSLVVGTLNKARNEEGDRNSSEAVSPSVPVSPTPFKIIADGFRCNIMFYAR